MGTVDSPWATAVDPCGLVTPFGPGSPWSLDWWIGADDRWHYPSTDAAVRQELVGDAPVVETRVRIPGGDAVQRVYGIRGEAFDDDDDGGDEWVVLEVENRSSVPFAVAFAIRPATPERLVPLASIDLVAVGGGLDRDPAQVVMLDGRAGLVFGRRPARVAASSAASGDVATMVESGSASEVDSSGERTVASCPDGLAQAAFLFPVAHTTTIRVVLPIAAEPGVTTNWPAVIPSAAHVVAGWDAHAGRSARMEIPDSQLGTAVAVARRSLLLAPWSDGLRHAGPVRHRSGAADELADAGRIVAALDRFGHHDDAARTLRRWPAILAGSEDAVETDIAVIDAGATHRLLAGDQELFDDLLPDLVAAVSRLDRAATRGIGSHDRQAVARSLATMALALDAAGQPEGAADVTAIVNRMRTAETDAHTGQGSPRTLLRAAITAITTGRAAGVDLLTRAVSRASPTFGFASANEPQDLVASAQLLDAVRALFVIEVHEGLDLLSVFPPQWYGGAVELHGAPTAYGQLSYAVRWHGTRPALLWELDQPAGEGAVRIAVPGLDPVWTTTQTRGETLLAEVAPPTGLQPVRLVTEHPDDGGTFA